MLAILLLLAPQQGNLTAAEFKQLHETIVDSKTAPWRTIAWRTSLLGAQGVAAEENKPLFIWAMDGHPLGCT